MTYNRTRRYTLDAQWQRIVFNTLFMASVFGIIYAVAVGLGRFSTVFYRDVFFADWLILACFFVMNGGILFIAWDQPEPVSTVHAATIAAPITAVFYIGLRPIVGANLILLLLALSYFALLSLLSYYIDRWWLWTALSISYCAFAVGFAVRLLPLELILAALPILVAYDVIAVYKLGFMQKVAKKILIHRLPLVILIPSSYPMPRLDQLVEKKAEFESAQVPLLMGLGDFYIPAIFLAKLHLTAAAAGWTYLPVAGGIAGLVIAFVCLNVIVERWKRCHPALLYIAPPVLAGTLLGFILQGTPLW